MFDGVSSKRRNRERSGPKTGSGLSRVKDPSPNEKLMRKWYDLIELPSWGKRTRTTVSPAAWAANMRKLRDAGLSDDEIIAALTLFSLDVAAERVDVRGKDSLWAFMARWHKYAAAPVTRAAVEVEIEETWTD